MRRSSELVKGPVAMELTFYFSRPQTHFHKRQRESAGGANLGGNAIRVKAPKYFAHQKSRDIDNLCKFVMDAFNGIVYEDDSQIVELKATKKFSCNKENTSYIDINIYEIINEDKETEEEEKQETHSMKRT